MAGVLLPVANILQALSDSGAVLAGGKIHTYVQGTTTNQSTYKQQGLSVAHANPIVLDSAGRLTDPVWATAGETFKLVFKTSADVQIGPTWDNVSGINDTSALALRYFAGTSGGTANAQTLTFSSGPAAYAQGNEFLFKAGNTNTGATTLNVNGLGAKTFKKEDENDLTGGEIIANRWYRATYDGTYLLLEALDNQEASRVDVASATTVDLDAADSAYVRITGSTGPIGTVTLSNGRECDVVFASTPTLTNSASLILPGGADITAAAGDTCRLRGEASSVVRCLSFTRAAVLPMLQGVHTIPVLAAAMFGRTTNGAAAGLTELATNDVMLASKDFDQTTAEGAQFYVPMPKSWNEGTVTAQFGWTAASGAGTVIWSISASAFSDDDAMDAAFGSAQTATDTLITANDMHISPVTSAITVGGTPAESDFVIFQITRDISDTLNADAKLIWCKVFITYSAGNDA
jgi:hypothetical protein